MILQVFPKRNDSIILQTYEDIEQYQPNHWLLRKITCFIPNYTEVSEQTIQIFKTTQLMSHQLSYKDAVDEYFRSLAKVNNIHSYSFATEHSFHSRKQWIGQAPFIPVNQGCSELSSCSSNNWEVAFNMTSSIISSRTERCYQAFSSHSSPIWIFVESH